MKKTTPPTNQFVLGSTFLDPPRLCRRELPVKSWTSFLLCFVIVAFLFFVILVVFQHFFIVFVVFVIILGVNAIGFFLVNSAKVDIDSFR